MASANSPQDVVRYQYTDLPPRGNWVRILYLDPAASKEQDIVTKLQRVNLDLNARPRTRSGNLEQHQKGAFGDSEYRPAYEALSWSWSNKTAKERISIRSDDVNEQWKVLDVPKSLAVALRALRNRDKTRHLWTDGICINMENKEEQANQVAKMDIVYKRALNVCVWLEEDLGPNHIYDCKLDELKHFICYELFQLENFDKIINSDDYAHKWIGLVRLMTKRWFSRRWIIQEIVLARRASVHIGDISIDWRQFEHAVSLFIKAESSNHRMSKMLGKDERLKYKKDFFWDIDRMGACSLVEITTSNFRRSSKGISEPASSLETLMAKLPMFESTDPLDTVYALLGIATDTRAETEATTNHVPDWHTIYSFAASRDMPIADQKTMITRALKVARMFAAGRRSKPYTVDYTRSPVEVYKEFVEFCIYRSRSLDIILRPWAPKPDRGPESNPEFGSEVNLFDKIFGTPTEDDPPSPPTSPGHTPPSDDWIQEMGPIFGVADVSYHEPMSPPRQDKWASHKRSFGQANGSTSTGSKVSFHPEGSNKRQKSSTTHDSRTRVSTPKPQYKRPSPQVSEMPTWICDKSQIPFTLSASIDESMKSMERKNADPLVGSPDTKLYNASGKLPVRVSAVQFRSRGSYDHSLFVEGFVLFEIADSVQHADLSNIPGEWHEFAGQDEGRLFRTMIADRGPNGARTPPYFVSAFREAFKNKQTTLEIKDAMHFSNSFMGEFLERVRQVTFNRKLIKTAVPRRSNKRKPEDREREAKENPRLGLAPKTVRHRHDGKLGSGDLVCILYGLSVPIVLKRVEKTREEKIIDHQAQQDQLQETFRGAVRIIEQHWSFRIALKDAIISLTRRHWGRYEEEGKEAILPAWRSSIRYKFPRLWLAEVHREYDAKQKRLSDGLGSEPIDVPRVGEAKPQRRDADLNDDRRDALWQKMVEEWADWLENPENANYVEEHKCRPYDAEVAMPNEYYKVVGECYIDEMMDGQALDYKKKYKIEDQIFELSAVEV